MLSLHHNRCEGVAPLMERKVLLDAADVSNLLQIYVSILIAQNQE